ncbi:MAG: HlyD family type I secretion periplasmic adaptor subunit [Pseudomonadota bacterium]
MTGRGPDATLDELVRRTGGRPWLILSALLLTTLGAFVAWASTAEVDRLVRAAGEVVPQLPVQIVQHLDGGIVEAVHVGEGQRVRAGAPLFQVRLPTTALNKEELEARRASWALIAARLDAELAGTDLVMPSVAAQLPELAADQARVLEARRAEHRRERAKLMARVLQRELEIDELAATAEALRRDLELARETLRTSAALAKDRLVSQLEHVTRQREVRRLEGELSTLEPASERAEAALAEAGAALDATMLTHRRRLLDERAEAGAMLAQIDEQVRAASEQRARTVVRAPLDGTVKNLALETVGGVVVPGAPLLEIVPAAAGVRVEARLRAADRGLVTLGQEARLKITAYDHFRFGTVGGQIRQISADTLLTAEQVPYFAVVIEPERASLDAAGTLPLLPGMEAEVDLAVGRSKLLDSIVEPFARVGAEAFREPR